MKKSCLTCKFEPEWGDTSKGDYPRQYGKCKWNKPIPQLPAVSYVSTEGITRFMKDDSGVHTNCKTWEPK